LKENSNILTISKIRNNISITKFELDQLEQILFDQGSLGSKADFIKAYGEQPLGKFIRNILGLDINAAKLAFGEILTNQTLNAQQIKFIDTIVNFFNVKGIVEPSRLFEPPFTDINAGGIIGLFDESTSHQIITLMEKINNNAEAA
jgi:type I restriction enzyme R subunit